MRISGFHLTQIGGDDFLLEPLPALDIAQPQQRVHDILLAIQGAPACYLFYDLSDLQLIDLRYYNWLNILANALKSVNTELVCINMQPSAACGLSLADVAAPRFHRALSIQSWRCRPGVEF